MTIAERLFFIALFSIMVACGRHPTRASEQWDLNPNHAMDASASPRIANLRKEIESGHHTALNQFWEEVRKGHAPLIETIPEDNQSSFVTFIWQGNDATDDVVVIGGVAGTKLSQNKLIHLADTDLWYKTYKVRNDARFVYSLSPNDSLIPIEKIDPKNREAIDKRLSELLPDPLNPLHDPGGMPSHYLELPEAPQQPWITPLAGVQRGKVKKLEFHSAILKNERDIWVYTPPGFIQTGSFYPLLVIFDGPDYIETVPVPVILDNLIAKKLIAPMVAISVGNPTSASRAVELPCSPTFADFLAKEIVPWMRKNYRATKDAHDIIAGGSSFGGLAAAFAGFRHPEVFRNVLS